MRCVSATMAGRTIVIRWRGHKAVAEAFILRLERDQTISGLMATLLLRRVHATRVTAAG